jgi:hypothetical protein
MHASHTADGCSTYYTQCAYSIHTVTSVAPYRHTRSKHDAAFLPLYRNRCRHGNHIL